MELDINKLATIIVDLFRMAPRVAEQIIEWIEELIQSFGIVPYSLGLWELP